jgi:hypothetical protein
MLKSTPTESLAEGCELKSLHLKKLEKVIFEIENGKKPSVVADYYKMSNKKLWDVVSSVTTTFNELSSYLDYHLCNSLKVEIFLRMTRKQ